MTEFAVPLGRRSWGGSARTAAAMRAAAARVLVLGRRPEMRVGVRDVALQVESRDPSPVARRWPGTQCRRK